MMQVSDKITRTTSFDSLTQTREFSKYLLLPELTKAKSTSKVQGSSSFVVAKSKRRISLKSNKETAAVGSSANSSDAEHNSLDKKSPNARKSKNRDSNEMKQLERSTMMNMANIE